MTLSKKKEMTPLQRYMSLSIQHDRYLSIVSQWKKIIPQHADPKTASQYTFTKWVTSTLEAALIRQKTINTIYKDYTGIVSDSGFIVEDKKTGELVRIILNDNGQLDSIPSGRNDCILFACLHPGFTI
jgi:hypothetical protein